VRHESKSNVFNENPTAEYYTPYKHLHITHTIIKFDKMLYYNYRYLFELYYSKSGGNRHIRRYHQTKCYYIPEQSKTQPL